MRMLQSIFETGLDSRLASGVLAYLLNSLWQVPLVFCAAWAAARLARPAGPRVEHRIWVVALLLEVVLPACHLQLADLGQRAFGFMLWFLPRQASGGQIRIVLGTGIAPRTTLPWQTAEVLAFVLAAYLCVLLYLAGRLAWGMWTTETMRRRAVELDLTPQIADSIARFESLLGLGDSKVQFASLAAFSGPATVGIRCPTLLLPAGFLDTLSSTETDALLAHEFAHMRRSDFAKNLIYGIISLPAAYHPLLSLTRARLAETRELVCDAMAAEAVGGRDSYARSLLQLASMLSHRNAPRILHAIGILDANIFERRIMNLTRKNLELTGTRRLAIVAGCAVVAIATCTSALALRMDVNQPPSNHPAPTSINVKSDALKLVNKNVPVYPVQAKKDRVQGTVVLATTIGKDGTVEHLRVVSGPSALQRSALDAVRTWRYQPFLLNGDPIEVKTTINVVYTLAK
ncbi:MAG: M56 family metallopeptidase [Terracidiphilus sp.]